MKRWFLAALLCLVPQTAHAEKFGYTDVQLLYGSGFDDYMFSNATTNRKLTTVTFEHFGAWEYGDNYFFADFTYGKFAAPSTTGGDVDTGERGRIYSEFDPRISLGKLAGAKEPLFGPIKDVLLAGQINAGVGSFWAVLGGGGIDFALPPPYVLGVNVYVRKDAFDKTTYQVTPFWEVPFHLWGPKFLFRGYIDVAGTDSLGVDVNSQPQLLWDVGQLAGAEDRVQVGVEWYIHRNKVIKTSAPQAMIRCVF